jgi:hypothetical protein
VNYEIQESRKRANGLLGIRIHRIKSAPLMLGSLNIGGLGTGQPPNPFAYHRKSGAMKGFLAFLNPDQHLTDPTIENLVPVYDWVADDGYKNIGKWVEAAALRGQATAIKDGSRC